MKTGILITSHRNWRDLEILLGLMSLQCPEVLPRRMGGEGTFYTFPEDWEIAVVEKSWNTSLTTHAMHKFHIPHFLNSHNFGYRNGVLTDRPREDEVGHSPQDMYGIRSGIGYLRGLGCEKVIRIQANCWHETPGWPHRILELMEGSEFIGFEWRKPEHFNTWFFCMNAGLADVLPLDVNHELEKHFWNHITPRDRFTFLNTEEARRAGLHFLRTKPEDRFDKLEQLLRLLRLYDIPEDQDFPEGGPTRHHVTLLQNLEKGAQILLRDKDERRAWYQE